MIHCANAGGNCNLQDSNAVVGEVLNLLVPACLLEVGVAPRVVVESEEIGSHVIGAAVHVKSCLHSVGRDIGSGVADWNLAETTGVHVVLHVTSNSLDIGSRLVGVLFVVDDLVTGEKGKSVGVFGEHLDGGKDTLKVLGIVRGTGVATVDGVLGVVDIEDQINTGILKSLHALVVVELVVDSIDTDCVDTKVLEVLNIAETDVSVAKRILVG